MADLTVKQVDALKPRDKPYKATVSRGLMIRVAPSGEKAFIVQYVVDKKQREHRLPHSYGIGAGRTSLADARSEAERIRAEARRGIDLPTAEKAEREAEAAAARAATVADIPISQLFGDWLADLDRADGGANLRWAFGKDVLPAIGAMPARAVTKADIKSILKGIVARGTEPRPGKRMAESLLADLCQMFKWALRNEPYSEILAGNPVAEVHLPDVVGNWKAAPRERVLSEAEIRLLARKMTEARVEHQDRGDRRGGRPLTAAHEASIWLLLASAVRVDELQRAAWTNLYEEAATWTIPADHAKNGRAHVVHLSAFALQQFDVLRRKAAGSRWVLPSRVGVGDTHASSKLIAQVLANRQRGDGTVVGDSLILPGGRWTAHDLRRTAATIMQEIGTSPNVIEACLNHSEPVKIRRTYQRHDYMPERRAAFDALGLRLQTLAADNVVILRTA